MLKSAIVTGSTTTHGGVISVGCETFTVQGKAVHLEGMKHFCPTCKMEVVALAGKSIIRAHGKRVIVDGDRASCGAVYIAMQNSLSIAQSQKPIPVGQNGGASKSDEQKYSGCYQLINEATNSIMKNVRYKITDAQTNEVILRGVTDDKGFTQRIPWHDQSKDVVISLEYEQW